MSINQPISLRVGTRVNDRYSVMAVVGRGGLGTVYRVADEWLPTQTVFALKETMDLSPGAREQFMREARWLQQLDHPNIPRVLHHFEWQDRLYLVMDFVSGENLEQKLMRNQDRPLAEGEVIAAIRPICDALAYLHAQNPPIVHRDVKPANIIVTSAGYPALVDLGIAKEHFPGVRNITATFIRKAGTEGYAPPEQYISNGNTGPWSDIYSLGATMYHLLTGRVPASAVERAALDGQLIAPRQLNPALSVTIEAIIMRALAIRPQDRFGSMREVSAALNDESLTKTTLIAPATKLPSKPLCPRCARPMGMAAALCANCVNELASQPEAALREAPAPHASAIFMPGPSQGAPIVAGPGGHPGNATFGSGPITSSARFSMPPSPAPHSNPYGRNSTAIARNSVSRPGERQAIERPKRLTRQVGRAATLAAAPTAPGSVASAVERRRGIGGGFPWRLSILILIVLTIIGGGVMLGSRALSLLLIDESSPQVTANGYFAALKNHDYQKAYTYFSAQGVSQLGIDTFTSNQIGQNTRLGDITAIQIVNIEKTSSSTRRVQISVTRSLAPSPVMYTLMLSASGDKWQIDSVASG